VDEQWRKQLLEAANVALDRLRARDADPGLVADLERFRAHLEAQVSEDDHGRVGP
jgi:hypothetical protein